MKWHREVDYHGSRSYGTDRPAIGGLSLIFAWLAAIARRRLRRFAPRPSPSAVLFHDGERSFSLLGARRRPDPLRPFPTMAELDERRRHPVSRLRHEN
jgi:hypothetical protein